MDRLNLVDLITLAFLESHTSTTDSEIESIAQLLGFTSMQIKQSMGKLVDMKIVNITKSDLPGQSYTVSLLKGHFFIPDLHLVENEKVVLPNLGIQPLKNETKDHLPRDPQTQFDNELQQSLQRLNLLQTWIGHFFQRCIYYISIDIQQINQQIDSICSIDSVNKIIAAGDPIDEDSSESDLVDIDDLIALSPTTSDAAAADNFKIKGLWSRLPDSDFVIRKRVNKRPPLNKRDVDIVAWFKKRLKDEGQYIREGWAREQFWTLAEMTKSGMKFTLEDIQNCFFWMIKNHWWGKKTAITKLEQISRGYGDYLVAKGIIVRSDKPDSYVGQRRIPREQEWILQGLDETCGMSYKEWRKLEEAKYPDVYGTNGASGGCTDKEWNELVQKNPHIFGKD